MKYYIGIDGGGTNTRACIVDEEQRIIGLGTSGPSSIDTVPIEETLAHIDEAIQSVVKTKHIQDFRVEAIVAGLGGVLTEESKAFVKNYLLQLPYVTDRTHIQVENDVYSAFLGGLANNTGICIIAGTGSVVYGVDESGKSHRAGGYGYQEGDLGSAYHLGMEAIRHVTRVFDKRLKPSLLSNELFNYLGITTVDDVMRCIMAYHNKRTLIASLAPFVTRCATSGDRAAQAICDQAIQELVLGVKAVYHALDLKNPEIAIIGSLGNSEGYFKTKLHEELLRINPQFKIHPPRLDPVVGSAYQAYRNGRLDPTTR